MKSGTDGEDRRLLSKCLQGDRKASEILVRQFSGLVYKSIQYTLMARHVSFNRYDLEDLHNTVFLKLFDQNCKKLRQFRGDNGCSLASWIRMISVRSVIDQLRKKSVDTMGGKKKCTPLEDLPELIAEGEAPDGHIEETEQARILQEGIQRLSPRHRLFVKLHFEQGMALAEVAETMKLTIGNAYTLKHRALQNLKVEVAAVSKID